LMPRFVLTFSWYIERIELLDWRSESFLSETDRMTGRGAMRARADIRLLVDEFV
jgi:hypothetical protein